MFRYLPPTIARSRLCIGRIAVIPPERFRRAAPMLSAMRVVPPRRRCPDGRLSGPVPGKSVDRKSVVEGKSVSVRVDLGGLRNVKKKTISKQRLRKEQYEQMK